MTPRLSKKIPPLFFGLGVLALDQASKALVLKAAAGRQGVLASYFGDFFYLSLQRNKGAAFSLLEGLPPAPRFLVLGLLPLACLLGILLYYFRSRSLTPFQDWAVLAIVSGGLGNIVDRLLRPLGVVDFLSFKVYGFLGYQRWPTFNVADSAVIAGGFLIIASYVAQIAVEARRGGKGAAA
jgi:signal peptidase II